ncbi:MAG: cation-translocating P-type ATPase [Anaerolineales bacterium]|nr:cation-translocating P-type ATPase [Anaerolineales bacterium]
MQIKPDPTSSEPSSQSSENPDEPSPVWHMLEPTELFGTLGTDPLKGLTSAEAAARMQQYGPNELQEGDRITFLQMILDQLNNFIVIVLIASSLISGLMGDFIESGAIIAIVVLNAVLGVVQEKQAEEALAALRKLAAPDAHVIRDGHRETVPARELVPGDVVLLESGNYVPADLRLLETVNLKVEEAALTGESVPVEKDAQLTLRQDVPLGDRINTAFSGTMVSYGRGRGVVISTGMYTQIGLIARMLQSVQEEQTPLQTRLDHLGKLLGIAALAVCAVVFGVGWLYGLDPREMFMVAVSLAVAAVPEGLAAVVTITLALGMREMIQRNALIRRLVSVETLGSTTVICSDKTGTLTQNQMTVTRIWVDGNMVEVTGGDNELNGSFEVNGKQLGITSIPALTTALWVAALDNDAVIEIAEEGNVSSKIRLVGDPTETAMLVAAAKAGARRENLEKAYPRIDEIPFDSQRKRMTTIHKVLAPHPDDASPFYDDSKQEWEVAVTKGAPDVVLDLCSSYQRADDTTAPLENAMRRQILAANESMAAQALRVLAVAYKIEQNMPENATPETVEHSLTFVGLVGMIDPARPEVSAAIETARRAGIRTVMITGDYPDTARAIAQEISLLQEGHQYLTGPELQKMSDEELKAVVQQTDVYARVSPEHKVRIVEALKSHNEVVAMTGDGVNDAPALKRADIGVAMGVTGTDVAKETADMVLTDDNYASIVAAVEQGRVIYSNIRKFVYYLISCNLAEIASIFIAILAGFPSPLTPLQLLWLNLITDGAPALALGMEKGDPDIMEQQPRPPEEPIINKRMQLGILVQTIAITGVTLTAFFLGHNLFPDSPNTASTMAFITLSFSELLRAFTARSENYPLLKIGIFSNKWMVYAVAASIVLLLAVTYLPFAQPIFSTVPLTWTQWEIILPLLVLPSVAAEAVKFFTRRKQRMNKMV